MLLQFKSANPSPPLPLDNQELAELEREFAFLFQRMSTQAQANSAAKGFWENGQQRDELAQIALMHSELSEGTEALRAPDPLFADAKVPQFSNLECELADTVIRIMDFNKAYGLNVGGAITAKMRYNQSRPHKHGKTC